MTAGIRTVYIDQKAVRLNARKALGKGGEADVFKFRGGHALKVFKPPNHPDFALFPDQAQGAQLRLDEHQQKLPAFPAGLNGRVIRPEKLAYISDVKNAEIVGYTMRRVDGAVPMLRLAERNFRLSTGSDAVVNVFRDLHQTLTEIHRQGVVIGDFNDLNILLTGLPNDPEAWIIDADSFQYGPFLCRLFTDRFVDPLLCAPNAPALMLKDNHRETSDWYAFNVMLVRALLLTDPYGGIYKPPPGVPKVPAPQRPLQRITVFHPDVRYPKPALPPEILPDSWLDHFERVFQRDERRPFNANLLDELQWQRCPTCGLEHSRRACPRCQVQLAMMPPARAVRGRVERTVILRTEGMVLALRPDGQAWLIHERGDFIRSESGRNSTPFAGAPDPLLTTTLYGSSTVVARDGQLHVLSSDGVRSFVVDTVDGRAALATNADALFWIDPDGRLLRDEPLGPVTVGEVLPGQTQIWAGESFGFGYYRAGTLTVGFVFETTQSGLNDSVNLPRMPGTWVRSTATFSGDRCYFLLTALDAGKTSHHIVVLGRDGRLEAASQADPDAAWTEGLHGACAVGSALLVPTDEGIVRLTIAGPDIVETGAFPDTEPFVDAGCYLLATEDGLVVVSDQGVDRLVIRQSR